MESALENCFPDTSGIYCFYTCSYNWLENRYKVKKLIYIGESENLIERLKNHEKIDECKKTLSREEQLCFSYAEVSTEDRKRAEAALVYTLEPQFNDQLKNEFKYPDTEIHVSGKHEGIPDCFRVTQEGSCSFDRLF